ncbi:MAG: phage gp6-like head-tail connector protein [Firmicutes bacterium]|nr:phage gp6-like head-tail connector protein [Bacillota bacterium]
MSLTLEEVKNYLQIDFAYDDVFIQDLISIADEKLRNSIDDYDLKMTNEGFVKISKIPRLAIIQHIYDNRGYTTKEDTKINKIIQSFMTQMQYCYDAGDTSV